MLLGKIKPLAALLALVLGLTVAVAAPSSADLTDPVAPTAERDRFNGYAVRVASFNILASTMAPGGQSRAHRAAEAVHDTRTTVIAFQEVARDQLPILRNRMPGFSFYPKRKYGGRGSAIQLAWKDKLFRVVTKGVIWRPFLGHQRPIPWVRLQHKETGRDFFAIAIHNAPGSHEAERDISTAKEIELIQRLERKRGKPVFTLGDMNERSEFCVKVARKTDQISMNDGTRRNPCPVPRRGGPDWMLGSAGGTDYSKFRKRYNGISDHPMLTARAWVQRNTR